MPAPDELERTYRYEGRVPTPEALRAVDGLTYVRQILAGDAPAAPIAATLAFSLTAADRGTATFEGTPQRLAYNPMGQIHGGWIATLLDSAMGCAVQTTLPAGRGYTTLELSVRMVRAVHEGTGPMRCVGRVVHAGGTVITAEGQLLDAAGTLHAHGATTCLVLAPRGGVAATPSSPSSP
ncbi:MAG: PaaI family thioesterase [Kofleriaceae bacterium]